MHHFINIDVPAIVPELDWVLSDTFTLNIYFSKQLPLRNDQLTNSFLLNCAAVVNQEEQKEIIPDFHENEAVYRLPLDDAHYITELEHIQLAFEPHEEFRGVVADFYPVTHRHPLPACCRNIRMHGFTRSASIKPSPARIIIISIL